MAHNESEYKEAMILDEPVTIVFTDSTGLSQERCVIPQRVWFGSTEWYPKAQWLLDAYDVRRHVVRSFQLSAIRGFEDHTDLGVPDRPADRYATR